MPHHQPAPIAYPDRLFIGGAWVLPTGAGSIEVLNSATENHYLSVAAAGAEDVERAVAAARLAFDRGPWPRMRPAERAPFLFALADELDVRTQDIAASWAVESGLVFTVAEQRIAAVAETYRIYARMADTFPFHEHRTPAAGNVGLLIREPVGVVGAIIPWNAPASLIAHKCAPALLAGCTVIVKASPEAPTAAYILAEACEKIGLPPGVVNVITAERDVSERLVRHPDVDKITFTGSTAAGRKIAALCGERIARFTLELGGKSPALVLDDYDVEAAAKTIAARSTFLTGQVCSALTRIIVPRRRHVDFVEALRLHFGQVRVGDPFAADTDMGPLAMARQRDAVERYIAAGVAEGATLACGGRRPPDLPRGYFIEPTVFGDVDNSSTIAREEIFGPVVCVIPADSDHQAVEIANDSIYGLNASVFTNDVDRAYAVARQLRSGTVGHNAHRTDFNIAFGGFKQSGIGREGGTEGLMPFLETKTIVLDGEPTSLV